MQKKLRFFLIFSTFFFTIIAKAQYAVNGYISQSKSAEKLVGAYVLAPYLKKGTSTNNYGYFSLNLPKDTATLLFSYVRSEERRVGKEC